MAHKKKQNDKNLYEGAEYKPEIIKAYSPVKYGVGEWVKNKEAIGGYEFVGAQESELLGYEIAIIGLVDGGEFSIIEHLPQSGRVPFDSYDEAREYFKNNFTHISPGASFKPYINRYSLGVIVDFEL